MTWQDLLKLWPILFAVLVIAGDAALLHYRTGEAAIAQERISNRLDTTRDTVMGLSATLPAIREDLAEIKRDIREIAAELKQRTNR